MPDSAQRHAPHLTLPLRGSLPLRPGGAERVGVMWGESLNCGTGR
jgi:hypothetical protein